jgi:PTH2 family peptidyl-tRNA hydrolase
VGSSYVRYCFIAYVYFLRIEAKPLTKANQKQCGVTEMSNFKYKQVIVVRNDLEISRGKTATQAGHAAVSAAEEARKHFSKWWSAWLNEGQCKIVVKVSNEKELLKLKDEAQEMGLPYALIEDRGLTEIPPGTVTCLGIGPAPAEKIDKITGKLSLL